MRLIAKQVQKEKQDKPKPKPEEDHRTPSGKPMKY